MKQQEFVCFRPIIYQSSILTAQIALQKIDCEIVISRNCTVTASFL
jgi:hypothetical protein